MPKVRSTHSLVSDRNLIDASDPNEIEKVVTKMHKEGYTSVHAEDVRRIALAVNNSRRRTYKIIRGSFNKIMEQPENGEAPLTEAPHGEA